jgi:hypothetical protein
MLAGLSAMEARMLVTRDESKVLQSIVEFVTIEVVDDLPFRNRAVCLFPDPAMDAHVLNATVDDLDLAQIAALQVAH